MTSSGSAHARFQRALETGNLLLIRAAAAELPRVDLADALAICEVVRAHNRRDWERATLRWLARYAAEQARAPADVIAAAAAFARTPYAPDESLRTLRGLLEQ